MLPKKAGDFLEEESRENVAVYGGYTTRHEYEKSRRERKRIWVKALYLSLLILLFIPAVFGVISLVRGDFFSPSSSETGGGSIRVPNQSELGLMTKDPDDMLEDLNASLIAVELLKNDGSAHYGSGFLISADGYALCSYDLVEDPLSIRSLRAYVNGKSYYANVVGNQKSLGFAVLRLLGAYGVTPVSVGNFSFVRRGDTMIAAGAVYGEAFPGTALSGMVASVGNYFRVETEKGNAVFVPMAYLDVVPNETVYGAPVVDLTGKVVAFCSKTPEAPYGSLTAMVPINVVYTLVNEILEGQE